MAIKVPYSANRNLQHNPADFPACKMFFKCSETSGSNIMDAVSGKAITAGITLDFSVPNAVSVPLGASMNALPLPSPIVVGSKSALLVTVMSVGGIGGLSLAASGQDKMYIGYTAGVSLTDGVNTALLANVGSSNITAGYALSFNPGANAVKNTALLASGSAVNASAAATPAQITNLGTLDSFGTIAGSLGSSTKVFGVALFVFQNGIPPDLQVALAWMTAQWQAGNKAIYPGWKGLL